MSLSLLPRSRGFGANPLPWIAAAAALVLAVQVTAAIVVGVAAQRDAAAATSEVAQLVGDSTSETATFFTRPAEDTVTEALTSARDGKLDPAKLRESAPDLYSYLRAHPHLGGVTVSFPGGSWMTVTRGSSGFEAQAMKTGPTGTIEAIQYNQEFEETSSRTLDSTGDVRQRPWYSAALDAESPQWTNPLQEDPEDNNSPLVVRVVGSSYDSDGALAAVASVQIRVSLLSEWLSEIPAVANGDAFILTSDRRVLAAPESYTERLRVAAVTRGAIPTATEVGILLPPNSSAEGQGVTGTAGSTTVYERNVSASGSPNWVVHVRVSSEELVPAVNGFQRTMLLYALAICAIVAVAAVLLWALRGPLGELARRARTDALTGLANRHEFHTRGRSMVRAAEKREAAVAVIAIDLDNFKSVNDALGHEAGDKALRQFARALQRRSGTRDVVGRLGGDEFAIVRWVADGEDVEMTVEAIRAGAEKDLRGAVKGVEGLGVSAGLATTQEAGYWLDNLLTTADDALVTGRRLGKGATYTTEAAASALD